MAKSKGPTLPRMVNQVQQTLDILFWALNRVLDDQGITVLHWAFMQRAYLHASGVPFSAVMKATGQSKDNVRRAAKFLEGSRLGKVIPQPSDHRARIFVLNEKGRKQALRIEETFEAKLLVLLGANLFWSNRVREFNWDLWCACGFLPPGDLVDLSLYQKADLLDDTRSYSPEPKRIKPLANPDLSEMPF
jgi:DNA-binding MarR family transcriptional regulator